MEVLVCLTDSRLVFVGIFKLFGSEGLLIHLVPKVGNIGHHKGDNQRHHSHSFECKLARTAIRQSERRLQIIGRGVECSMVISSNHKQSHHSHHSTRAREPNASLKATLQESSHNAPHQKHCPHKKENQHHRHLQKVVQILMTLH